MNRTITRLAPSPTGALHLGNARTFLINWLLARQNGWHIVLRIDDLDGPRIKSNADQQAIADLQWLGLNWDAGPVYQSSHIENYTQAIELLIATRHAYPCNCTRREIELASSAPHAEDGASIYPGTCRGKFATVADAYAASGRAPAIRFLVPNDPIEFHDTFHGSVRYENPAAQLGDFVIAKSDGSAAYQLAVVVDDHDANITQVVRGDDLLDSTPRQMLIYRALGWQDSIPNYTHLPLVIGADGRRLAKRHGDTRVAHYHESGVSSARMLGLLARWCGIDCGDEISINEMLEKFAIDRLPRWPITIENDAFLT